MMIADLPPNLPEPVICCIEATQDYGLPPAVVLSVAQAEDGQAGLWVENGNKTYDVGVMQFNTAYLKTLKPYGITPEAVEASGCYPYKLAAWRIAGHLKNDKGDYWSRVANYHSRSPALNLKYQSRLLNFFGAWMKWFKDPSSPLPWTGKKALNGQRKIVTRKTVKPEKPILSFEDYLKSKGF